MKKVLLTLMAALLIASVPASAQQRRTAAKRTTTAAKRTAPSKKPASQPVTIQMDEPCIAGGAIAFNGIPITLSDKEMASELTEQGFKLKKDDFGERWFGKAFGVEGNLGSLLDSCGFPEQLVGLNLCGQLSVGSGGVFVIG